MRAQVTLDTLEFTISQALYLVLVKTNSTSIDKEKMMAGDYRIPRSGKRDTGSGISIGYINHFHPPNLELVMTVVDQVVAAPSIPKKAMQESTS
jgi:hypothetical protein